MRLDIRHHFSERFYDMANAALSTEISSAASTVASLSTALDAANSANVSLSTALGSAADTEDTADAGELSSAISGALVPAEASVSAAA